VEIPITSRKYLFFPPLARGITVLVVAGFVAYQLGKSETTPGTLLVVAAIVALVVAVQLVPHGPLHVRKPEQELDAISLRKVRTESATLKRTYSPPHLAQLESREYSELAWESPGEDESFQFLRPFYIVYPGRNFTAIAASLKFQGDKDYRGWQPVANSAPQQSQAGDPDEHYQWILIGYVPPKASFDAKLKLRDSQSRFGVAVVRNLVASEDRPFQSIHLKLPTAPEHFVAPK
jgi:hypothetical protein